jgi:hypothetical protein
MQYVENNEQYDAGNKQLDTDIGILNKSKILNFNVPNNFVF